MERIIDWTTRAGTQDGDIIAEVIEHNAYRVPERSDSLAGFVVIDVGANIGAFTVLALERGADYVLAVEADLENYRLLQENVAKHPRGISHCAIEHRAVVGHWSGMHEQDIRIPVGYEIREGQKMTGGKHIFEIFETGNGETQSVHCVCVCYLIERARRFSKKILLKLDCERAEHQILDGAPNLAMVDRIVGESHTIPPGFDPLYPHEERSIATLERSLSGIGFSVSTKGYPTDGSLHLFWAERAA